MDPFKSAVKYLELLRPEGVSRHEPVDEAFDGNLVFAHPGSFSSEMANA